MRKKALNHAAEKENVFSCEVNFIDVHFDTSSTSKARTALIRSYQGIMPSALNCSDAVDLIA